MYVAISARCLVKVKPIKVTAHIANRVSIVHKTRINPAFNVSSNPCNASKTVGEAIVGAFFTKAMTLSASAFLPLSYISDTSCDDNWALLIMTISNKGGKNDVRDEALL
jgi:hypothetical protein